MRIRPDWEQPPAAGRGTSTLDEATCPHCCPQPLGSTTAPVEPDGLEVVRAIWNGLLLARSARTVRLDGVLYFPAGDVRRHYLRESGAVTVCPVDGQVDYLDVVAYGSHLTRAAWYWRGPSPSPGRPPAGYIGFAPVVQITGRQIAG